jgi:hypothetical protein
MTLGIAASQELRRVAKSKKAIESMFDDWDLSG